MKSIVGLSLCMIVLCAISSISFAASDKPRMAVMRFTNNTHASWWNSGMGSELSDMLTNELASTKKFRLSKEEKSTKWSMN